jgi:hypothetical protein
MAEHSSFLGRPMTGTPSFEFADRRIDSLVKTLLLEGICPGCLTRALVRHAGMLGESAMYPAADIKMLEIVFNSMREDGEPNVIDFSKR